MASDQKRWFKVWTSLLVDMDNRSAEDVGHWTRLGCRIALVGSRGSVGFDSWDHVGRFFGVTVEVAQTVLQRLPSVSVEVPENRHGVITVTMKNWIKYQEDSTQAERQHASRSKRRGDKKRGEVPLSPRARGENPRALGINPRALGTNPRASRPEPPQADRISLSPDSDPSVAQEPRGTPEPNRGSEGLAPGMAELMARIQRKMLERSGESGP